MVCDFGSVAGEVLVYWDRVRHDVGNLSVVSHLATGMGNTVALALSTQSYYCSTCY